MTAAEIDAAAKLAGELVAAIWAALPPQQKAALEAFAIRTGKRLASVVVHAVLAYGAKRLTEGGVGFPEMEALYASPWFPNPLPQEGPEEG